MNEPKFLDHMPKGEIKHITRPGDEGMYDRIETEMLFDSTLSIADWCAPVPMLPRRR